MFSTNVQLREQAAVVSQRPLASQSSLPEAREPRLLPQPVQATASGDRLLYQDDDERGEGVRAASGLTSSRLPPGLERQGDRAPRIVEHYGDNAARASTRSMTVPTATDQGAQRGGVLQSLLSGLRSARDGSPPRTLHELRRVRVQGRQKLVRGQCLTRGCWMR